jgi:hypothetical protein
MGGGQDAGAAARAREARARRLATLTSEPQKEKMRSDAAHQVGNPDQDDRANRRYDQGPNHPLGPCNFQLREDPPTHASADEPEAQVPNQTVAGTVHQLPGKPAGENSDYDCADHQAPRVGALTTRRMMHARALKRQCL